MRIHGTHTGAGMGAPTNRELDAPCVALVRFEGDKVREVHQVVDRLAVQQAMGVSSHEPAGAGASDGALG